MSLSVARPSLRNRMQALWNRWTMHFGIAWGDFFQREAESYSTRQKRENKAWLDVDPLETRQMPSYSASLFAYAAADPFQDQSQSVGRTSVSLLEGSASQSIPVNIYRSDTGGPSALVYNSNTVGVKPIVTVQVTSGVGDPVPTSISVTLIFNGHTNTPVSFSTTGHSAGDTYLLGVQEGNQITSSAYYSWSMSISLLHGMQPPTVLSPSGSMPIVVRDTSSDSFGRGWSLVGLDGLLPDANGAMYIFGGTGGSHYFSLISGNYVGPDNEFGTLVKNAGVPPTYTYTALDQTKTNFDTNGRITTRVDPHGLTTSYTFDGGGKLTKIENADGAVTTFTYDGSNLMQTVVQPGNLTLTMAHASGSDLTSVQYPDGANRTFTYDGSHRLTKEQWGSQTATLAYSGNGMLSSIDRGGGDSTSYTPELSQGLQTTPAKNASDGVAVVTDPLSNKATYTLDTQGRTTKHTLADGGIVQKGLNSGGLATKVTDQLNNVTSFTYSAGTPDLTKVELSDGGVQTFAYDATFHKVNSQIDPLGNRTTLTYDATTGDPLTVKDALNGVTTLVWGDGTTVAKGLLVASKDSLNHNTTIGYDASRRMTTMTDALGNVTSLTYDDAGRLTRRETPFTGGGTVADITFSYDAMGRFTQVQDALGNSTSFAYDSLGEVTDQTDALGRRTTYAYDSRGNLTGFTEAVGTGEERRIAFTYDAANRMTARTDGLSHTTTYGYDSVGRSVTIKDALGNVTTNVYDLAGRMTATAQIDALSHRTTFGYDSLGRRTIVQDALGNVTTTAYDSAGNVLSVKNALGVTTSYAYDAVNRQTSVIEDKGGTLERTTTIAYDSAGNVTSIADPQGDTTTFTYDSINRQVTKTDPLGHTITTAYFALTQQVAQTTDALGNTTTMTFDKGGQIVSVQRPGGGTETFAYDAVGNQTVDINELSNRTTYAYDSLDRLISQTNSLAGITTIAYDAASNRTAVVDPLGNRTTLSYDSVNRLVSETDPLNHSATYSYDAIGRLTSTTDRLGRRRDFTYDDDNNKLTEKWYANGGGLDQTQTWAYDALGQTLSAVDPDGANTFTYDALHRVKTVQEPFGLTLTYTYDAADNRTVFQDSKGGLETFAYDAANRLTSVKFTNSLATVEYDFVYDARDSITKLTRFGNINGTATVGWTSFTYDTRGRLTNEQHRDSSNASLNNTTFTYDDFDRLTTKVVDGTTITYSYDNTNQVTSDGTRNYSYDANGNRNSAGYTTGTGNQTTNDGTWTYTYDNEGNLSKKSKGANLETWNYSYDQQNHLITVEKHATDGGAMQLKVQYKYDALGFRIERTEDNDGNGSVDVTNRFGYDGANVWADLDGSNGLTYRRLFGQGVDNPIARITAAGTVVWYLTDYQNSVIGLVDYLGASLGSTTYDNFGNIVVDTTGISGDRFRFTGREWDLAAKLQYNRARYYDPTIGKWTSMDPLGFGAGDANLYRYVANASTNAVDPSGLLVNLQEALKLSKERAEVYRKFAELASRVPKPIRDAIKDMQEKVKQERKEIDEICENAPKYGTFRWYLDESTGVLAARLKLIRAKEDYIDALVKAQYRLAHEYLNSTEANFFIMAEKKAEELQKMERARGPGAEAGLRPGP